MSALSLALGLIKQFEGCRLHAYPDPQSGGDPWTIGYGATGEGIGPGTVWTQEQCDNRLLVDVQRFMRGVQKLTGNASDCQLAAMTSFAYNIGLHAFEGSTLLRKFRANDIDGAAHEFDKWVKAPKSVKAGLIKRRRIERAMFEGRGA